MTTRFPHPLAAGPASRASLARIAWLAAVGGIATALYAALTLAATRGLDMSIALASPAAYGLAAIWSYHGHRLLTFAERRPGAGAGWRFTGATLVGYGAACAIPAALTGGFGLGPEISIIATCVAAPALNYLALSRIVFADRPSRE